MSHGNGQWAYLSCVKDGATKQILAHYLSSSLELSLVERTLDRLLERLDGNIHPEAIIHSDQGMHYTHPKFRLLVSKAGFKQSMSRKGNCWDNASMETFFGHMKDELEYRECETLQELRECVNDYIEYYNSGRYQWTLKKRFWCNNCNWSKISAIIWFDYAVKPNNLLINLTVERADE